MAEHGDTYTLREFLEAVAGDRERMIEWLAADLVEARVALRAWCKFGDAFKTSGARCQIEAEHADAIRKAHEAGKEVRDG